MIKQYAALTLSLLLLTVNPLLSEELSRELPIELLEEPSNDLLKELTEEFPVECREGLLDQIQEEPPENLTDEPLNESLEDLQANILEKSPTEFLLKLTFDFNTEPKEELSNEINKELPTDFKSEAIEEVSNKFPKDYSNVKLPDPHDVKNVTECDFLLTNMRSGTNLTICTLQLLTNKPVRFFEKSLIEKTDIRGVNRLRLNIE